MADTKISALDAIASIVAADLYAVIDDPGGTPVSKKATHTQLLAFIESSITVTTSMFADFAGDVAGTAAVTANTAKVTNATHTGDVTGSGALTIADNAVTLAMMAHGTDGNLITYDSAGAPAAVATGTAGQILTSNGAGAAPTFETGGAGGDLTLRIPLVMEVPEGTVAYPDIHALATATAKVSGMVLPDGASVSTINLKCDVPNNLASTPAASIKFHIIGLGTGTTDNVRLTVSTLAAADAESVDQAFTAETEATVPIPDTAEVQEYYDQDMTTDPTAGDQLLVQLARDPTDASDDYAADIMIIGAYLEIDVTPA